MTFSWATWKNRFRGYTFNAGVSAYFNWGEKSNSIQYDLITVKNERVKCVLIAIKNTCCHIKGPALTMSDGCEGLM